MMEFNRRWRDHKIFMPLTKRPMASLGATPSAFVYRFVLDIELELDT